MVFKKIWIFDRKLNLIKSFGRKGKGPGEFESSPLIILKDSSIVLYDFRNYRATILSRSFELARSIQLKREKIVRLITPLYIKDNYVFAGGGTSSRLEDLFNGSSLLLLDNNFKYLDEILNYDEKYEKRNAFIVYNDKTYLAKGNNNSFFALQSAAKKIFHLDDKFNVEYIVEISPKYYKEPPEDDIRLVSKSLETMGEFYSKITCFKKLDYDFRKDFKYIYYVNYYKEMVTERNWLKGDHYLQVLDKDYNTIFDNEINGIFSFVENGNIYILTEENPGGLKIDVYKLIKDKNG